MAVIVVAERKKDAKVEKQDEQKEEKKEKEEKKDEEENKRSVVDTIERQDFGTRYKRSFL